MLGVLTPLLSLVGIEADELKQKLTQQAVIWGVIGALALIALCFLLVALNAGLTSLYGPIVAPLIVAAAAIVIALVVYLLWQLRAKAEARAVARKRHDGEVAALLTTAVIAAIPLILPLLRDIGLPAGAALASSRLFRKPDDRERDRRR